MHFYCHLSKPNSIKCHEQCALCRDYENSLELIDNDIEETISKTIEEQTVSINENERGCLNCGLTYSVKDETKARLNRNTNSVIFIDWLIKQPSTEFRISKQKENHYVIHPLNTDGETFDLKW